MKGLRDFEFDRGGKHFRVEKRGETHWPIYHGNKAVGRIPIILVASPEDLQELAMRVADIYLEGKTPEIP